MLAEIRITVEQLDALRSHLLSDENEHAAILLCGVVPADVPTLACRSVVPLGAQDLLGRGESHLEVSPVAIARWTKRAAASDGTVIICHSHPFPGPVDPSSIDLRTESHLCGEVLPRRLAGRPVGALIAGPDGVSARLWSDGASIEAEVVVPGHRAEVVGHSKIGHRSDRQVLVWGQSGQSRLAAARVAIVGVGGTGSHVAQQLAHLGVGELLLIDPDLIEESNLSRLVGASHPDVGRSKVEAIAKSVAAVNPVVHVNQIQASVVDIDPSMLASADLIMCCTDGHGSRALLTELVQQYLVPCIDMGVEVLGTRGSSIAGGGVRILMPGHACLHCMGIIDPALVREEYLSEAERSLEKERGYIRGVNDPAPSVIALNGVVASLAVMEALHLLLGLFESDSSRIVYRADHRMTRTVAAKSIDSCYVCGGEGLLGRGDRKSVV